MLAENLEEHLDEFRGTVVNCVMSVAEEKMDTDAFEESFRDDAVLGQLKTKLETGLEDMMTTSLSRGHRLTGLRW